MNPFGAPSNNNQNNTPTSTNPFTSFGINSAVSNTNQATPFGISSNVDASPSVGNTNATFGSTPFGTSTNDGGISNINSNNNSNPFGKPSQSQNDNPGFGAGGFGTSTNLAFNKFNNQQPPMTTTSTFGQPQQQTHDTNRNATTFGTFTNTNNNSGTGGGFGTSSNIVFGAASTTSGNNNNNMDTNSGSFSNNNNNMSMMNKNDTTASSSPFGGPSIAGFGSGTATGTGGGGFGNRTNNNNNSGGFGTTSSSPFFEKPKSMNNVQNSQSNLNASAAPFAPILERVADEGDNYSGHNGGGTAAAALEKKRAEEKLARLKARIAQVKAKVAAKSMSSSIRPVAQISNERDGVAVAVGQDQMIGSTATTAYPTPNASSMENTESSTSGISAASNNTTTFSAETTPDEQILTIKRSTKKTDLKPSCRTMCPLAEIERRQECNEISILEQLHPQIFPNNFTLKNTCVKKFRRSAADVDLSVDAEVRDPVTIEKSMAFLEEWIMDRDRQGVDPRSGNVLDSLDVYQFMWDRTRMLRKDLLLQNIPSMTKHSKTTTTLDDLNIAIRVHERITRWHVLCEHQLSHLDDWAQQTSQNVVEMGQCLKSLNMLYDQRRRLIEDGAKSRQDAPNTHGCTSAKVHGIAPCDYDGRSLDISESYDCIVGNGASDGTIEPEMRGLYILLMFHQNTDFKNFLMMLPYDLHKTAEVKLAIEVVISLRHRDYAKFFKVLRSRCGYIYSCVVFKHVNTMRKSALQIMSKIYGRVPNEYPLERLTRLLCFNDDDETITHLKHYSIPYNERTRKIEFEHSTFNVPDKKIPVKKMAVIEFKVTRPRIYICRGGCETVLGVKRRLPQVSSIPSVTKQALDMPLAPTNLGRFGKVANQVPVQPPVSTGFSGFGGTINQSPIPTFAPINNVNQVPVQQLTPTGFSGFGGAMNQSPVPAFAPTNVGPSNSKVDQSPVQCFAPTNQQSAMGLPTQSGTGKCDKKLKEEEIRQHQENEAKAEAEKQAQLVFKQQEEEREAERQRQEKRRKEEEAETLRIEQEKERQRRIEQAEIEERKAAEAVEVARLAKLKAEAERKARLEAEERVRLAELKAEAERKARLEAERIERERLAELERRRLQELAAEKRRQQKEIDRATKAFFIRKWHNHPNLVKRRREHKTRLSLEKLSSMGSRLYDISDFDATLAGITICVPSLDKSTSISNFFSQASINPNLMNVVNLLSDGTASSSIILMKIAIVLPQSHPLNPSMQLWLESRLSLNEVSSIATARFCAVFAININDLAGCDSVLFIRPPAELDDTSFDAEIMEYSKKNLTNCTIEMHLSDAPPTKDPEDSDLVVNLRRPSVKMMDKMLLRGIYKLIRTTNPRALEKVNLASSLRLIFQTYLRDRVMSISQIDRLFHTMIQELHVSLSQVPDRFIDYPAVEFAVDDIIEGYYLYDTDAADLPLSWRVKLSHSETHLRKALTERGGLPSILRRNQSSISVQQQVKFYLSRNENYLAIIATIQHLENNNDFEVDLPFGFMHEVIRIVGEKISNIFVESMDPMENEREVLRSKEYTVQSADRARLYDDRPAMKPRTLSFDRNEAAKTKRPLDLITAAVAKDFSSQSKPEDVLLDFIDIGEKNQRPQSPKRHRTEISASKSWTRRNKSNNRRKFLRLSESTEYTKRLEAMLSGKSSIDFT